MWAECNYNAITSYNEREREIGREREREGDPERDRLSGRERDRERER